jgi:membrane fusion protein, copper/silver efflux system
MRHSSFLDRLRASSRSFRGWATAAKAALLIGIGFLLAWLVIPSGEHAGNGGKSQRHAAGHAEQAGQTWTCSMHPQIQRPGPGQCPICGMDLIPVGRTGATLTSLRQLELSPTAKQLMNIEVRPVERKFVTAQVRMVGKVEYDETRVRRITSRIAGRLDRLYVDYTGVEVRQGDHMVYIYSPELYSAQQELILALRSDRERRRQSDPQSVRGIDLLESSRDKLRLLGLTDEQISEIEQRERPSSHLTIYAPIGGIVVEKLKKEGDYVQTGEQIYTVADLTQVWVQLDAYESDFTWIRYGQDVTFTTEAYPGETFHGRVAFIDPILDDRTRTKKVRVNLANPEGKLKPNMFVRGVASSQLAVGGRVVEPELAGKWISPMHPEIVKDEPGPCDICGMPLVRAESLGYVSSEDLLTEAPLVIPTSAVLWTGTRAIVYVVVPEADEPTFEGREIVLGPRAGEDYLVRDGLREGDLVVTRGNFKIDSALQIQARPSMMTPEGGGGGGHQHDHDAPSPSGEQPADRLVQAPSEFLAQLEQLKAAYRELLNSLEDSDLDRMRAAFARLGIRVGEVDVELVRGHTAMLWKEFGMLLRNDALEGQAALDADTAQRIARGTKRTMERVHEQLMEPQLRHAEHADHIARRLEVPEEFSEQLAKILQGYFQLQTALATDELAAAQDAVRELGQTVEGVSDDELSEATRHAWHRERDNLHKILSELGEQEELNELRGMFSSLSGEMEAVVHRFGAGEAGPIYRVHCPMAMENRGAWWLQQSEEIRNPYFGSTMLRCHDRLEKIASGTASPSEEHVHE